MSEEKFEQWGVVEIMGHQRVAGKVTEQAVGGTAFVRVDVPESDGRPAFTKLYGSGAIYAISITSEETARAIAARLQQAPISVWDARDMVEKDWLVKQQPALTAHDGDSDDQFPI